ncbi:MAG: 1-(5-phosphoribosyl)-5-[(5-phosphoribosylamino)methylideneamino]imidazole-4-carboxamide isomerase [Candidatus Lokiarchaeota archaeon]|nr:1-(5-phosphoribosyl)-5-[(5-phosphoribosylamino)methylideneamino]imidazole-4-carboxamide isomerase [Candidatus Lokiarchaeota archaeon]
MLIIPAIDLKDGKCVRLFKGIESNVKVYDEDPIKMARYWQDQGSKQLHIIDLDGAFGKGDNLPVIKNIITQVDMQIQVGGGIRTLKKAENLFEIGIDRLIIGTSAMKDPKFVQHLVDSIGGEHVCVALDFRDESVLIKGWTEKTTMNVFDAAKLMESKGARWMLFTSQEADGTLEGISSTQLEITKKMVQKSTLKVIAAGGITTLEDLNKLNQIGVAGSVIGKALYENKLDIKEAFKKFQ